MLTDSHSDSFEFICEKDGDMLALTQLDPQLYVKHQCTDDLDKNISFQKAVYGGYVLCLHNRDPSLVTNLDRA